MIKAIICDLDGTLLSPDHTISEFTLETIKEIKSRGIEIFIATGRHHKDAAKFRQLLELDTYLITSNGAKAHDANDKEIISHNIPTEITETVLDFKIHPDITFNLYVDDLWYANRVKASYLEYYKESGFDCNVCDVTSLKGKEATKFFFVNYNNTNDVLSELESHARKVLGDTVDYTFSMPNCFEILKKGVSKGSTVKQILDMQKIDAQHTIAFGDGLNDYEMLSLAKTGVVMGNATEKLRTALPNNPVAGTNAENGLAKWLQANLL